jgi:putative transposase
MANYRVYGARKLWKAAGRAGHDIGRDQVARLMRAAGIEGVRRGPKVRTTSPTPPPAVIPIWSGGTSRPVDRTSCGRPI